jgi:hypothetical protein
MKPKSELILYQTEDNRTRIEVRLENETVWISLNQMAELFQTTKQNVSLHIQNIYAEGELRREATVKEYLTVQKEGSREVSRSLEHYNLDVIISVLEREIDQQVYALYGLTPEEIQIVEASKIRGQA